MNRRQFVLERTVTASIDDVWALWTTKDGLESWWGPEGFAIRVDHLDVREGGELRYAMIAVDPEMVAFMRRSNMPVETPSRIVYREVAALRRIACTHDVDFVPSVAAYQVETTVDFAVIGATVQMTVRCDAMHDEAWTARAQKGWEQQLGKLARRFDR